MSDSTYTKIVKLGASLVRALDPNTDDSLNASATMAAVKTVFSEVSEDIGRLFSATETPKIVNTSPQAVTPSNDPVSPAPFDATEGEPDSTLPGDSGSGPGNSPSVASSDVRVSSPPQGKVVNVTGES